MRIRLFAATLLLVSGQMALAQQTTQVGGVTPSGDPVFSEQVTGANGLTYNCRPEITTSAGGVPARVCRQVSGTGTGTGTEGFGNLTPDAGIAAVGALVLVGALAGGGGGSTTTSTN